jgi:non-specific serine/threonine protein kinase
VVPSRPGEPLLGRRRELADLRRALGSARLVTLTGQGGIGKTTLARGAATDHERARREDTWAVDLADLVDPDLLGHSVAGAFGVQLPYGAAGAADVAAAVADRAGLLVLDGCEAMLDAAVELVAVLLATAPRLRVLATSQGHLGVTGEVVVPVGPLAADEAQALFAARAAAALPSFRLTDDNAAAVARLCEALEWVPLAIELAAARIVVLSPQGILDRLGDRQRLLAKGARDAPARHRSLRASLEASNELCTPAERLLWAQPHMRGMKTDSIENIQMLRGMLERAQTIPGVEHAARALTVPFWSTWEFSLYVAGIDSVSKLGDFTLQAATPNFFSTMGTRLLRGRAFTAADGA